MYKFDYTTNTNVGSLVSKTITLMGVITVSLFAVMSVLDTKHLGKIPGIYELTTSTKNKLSGLACLQ